LIKIRELVKLQIADEMAYLNPHAVHSSMASRAEVEAIREGSWTTTASNSQQLASQCNISRWATGA